ncbi:MAG: hypothetical protein L6408_06640 [Nanoarchaeota archaeon]|nr:hypothetical protein [Nanoarchaeota archaeon]
MVDIMGTINFETRPERCISDEEKEEIKKYLSSAVEEIKKHEYTSGVQKLVKIEQILEEKDEHKIPTWYMPHEIGGWRADAWPEEFAAYESEDGILLQILFGKFSETWEDYYQLLREMGNTDFLKTISERHWQIWIDPNSILSPWFETLIVNEKMDCAEILCNNLSNALIDAETVLELVGLGKKYMEQLNTKTKEFDEKIKQLKENNQIYLEKAKMITENSVKKYCPPNINSDIIIKSIPSYKSTYNYLISGEAFIDFCTKKSGEMKGVDFSGPCLYYFKAVETFMCDRIKEIIKPNIPVYQKHFGRELKTITSGSSDWNNLSLYDYEKVIVEILKQGAPFSKKIADSITWWRQEIRNSKVHKNPVSDFDTVLKVKIESYKLLSTLFSVLVKENIQEKYVRMNI